MDGKAWRFNRYAERALQASGVDHPPPDAFEHPAVPAPAAERP
jgi:hypothetical protein